MSEYYRLLNEGEIIQEGDQYYLLSSWSTTNSAETTVRAKDYVYRRKITLPEWRPISEVPRGITVLVACVGGTPVTAQFHSLDKIASCWTHWTRRKWVKKYYTHLHEAWLAALQFAKGK